MLKRSFIEIARLAKLRHEVIKLFDFDAGISTEIIKLRPPGRYTLREMYGEYWEMVVRARWYGVQFCWAVGHQQIKHNVRRVGKKSNGSVLYEIF
jgi:hypothetical protein